MSTLLDLAAAIGAVILAITAAWVALAVASAVLCGIGLLLLRRPRHRQEPDLDAAVMADRLTPYAIALVPDPPAPAGVDPAASDPLTVDEEAAWQEALHAIQARPAVLPPHEQPPVIPGTPQEES